MHIRTVINNISKKENEREREKETGRDLLSITQPNVFQLISSQDNIHTDTTLIYSSVTSIYNIVYIRYNAQAAGSRVFLLNFNMLNTQLTLHEIRLGVLFKMYLVLKTSNLRYFTVLFHMAPIKNNFIQSSNILRTLNTHTYIIYNHKHRHIVVESYRETLMRMSIINL